MYMHVFVAMCFGFVMFVKWFGISVSLFMPIKLIYINFIELRKKENETFLEMNKEEERYRKTDGERDQTLRERQRKIKRERDSGEYGGPGEQREI